MRYQATKIAVTNSNDTDRKGSIDYSGINLETEWLPSEEDMLCRN